MEDLWKFIEKCCEEQGIDESHGLKHSKAVVGWAEQLMAAETNLSDDEKRMVTYAAALHDMCDSKYTDVTKSSQVIKAWLLEQGWNEHEASVLISIITTMSYSKLKKAAEMVGHRVWPDHGKWQLAYHITRNADLLDGYKVERCFQFQKHKSPDMSDDEAWILVEKLFENRVLRYVSDGWITLPKAIQLAKDLDAVARIVLVSHRLVA